MALENQQASTSRRWKSGRGANVLSVMLASVTAILLWAGTCGAQTPSSKWVGMLPDGAGKELIAQNCQLCHTLERVVTSHRPKEEWEDLVSQMMDRGCPIHDADVPKIIEYLAASFGPAHANPPAGSTLAVEVSGGVPKSLMVDPDQVQFTAVPDSLALPKSIQMFIIAGDPSKAGAFSVLLKVPAGQVIPSYWAAADECIVALRGAFEFGEGKNFDEGKLQALKSGAVLHIPAQMHHFGRARDAAIILISGVGPLMFADSN